MIYFGLWTIAVALCISAVAAYYSIIGLVAIFSAAMLPIIIMGAALEVGKLTTAVWLHLNWDRSKALIKTYLSFALVILMFITSMGIFGFLSKAHIEQTSASEETVAKVAQIETEIGRLNGIIARAEDTIKKLESTGTGADTNIQSQIDKEQERIDKAFERIQPAIQQQNKIIEDARTADGNRTKPYEDQLANIQAEVTRLEQTAREYEDKIASLKADDGIVNPLLEQISAIEKEIIRVTNQLNSKEQQQIRAAQAIIGVTSDGLFGGNTRTALATWVKSQRDRIAQIQGEVARARQGEKDTVANERSRLAGIIKDIREKQIKALKDRELTMLAKIDEVRQTESPAIKTARDEIQRLRESAEGQVKQSQDLIKRLQEQLADTSNAQELDTLIDEQQLRVKNANSDIDKLTEEKYALQAEYRKLEAEVGPVKYIAEFVYGDQADTNMLEAAVRWVILLLVIVFDPLAVVLVIAGLSLVEQSRRHPRLEEELKDDNWPYIDPDPIDIDFSEETKDESREETSEPPEQVDSSMPEAQPKETVETQAEDDSTVVRVEEEKQVKIVELETVRVGEFDSITGPVRYKGRIFYPDHPDYRSAIQQVEENAKARIYKAEEKSAMVNRIVAEMKSAGTWPGIGSENGIIKRRIEDMISDDATPELKELLSKADESTLKQVYEELIKNNEN